MDTMAQRLKVARERRYASVKEATDAFGWTYNTYAANENGNAPFSYKAALKYATAFKVSPEWLYRGEGQMGLVPQSRLQPIRIPLISWVTAGQLRDPAAGVADEWITAAGLDPNGEYFATQVDGDSMDRLSPAGSIIICDERQDLPLSGKAYVFEVDGETTYKLYQDDPVVRLEPYSTNPSHRPIFVRGPNWRIVGKVVRSYLNFD